MTVLQRNIFACFMGFAVLSIFNVNHAFAHEGDCAFNRPAATYEKGDGDGKSSAYSYLN